jgi:hypothetical protein
MARAISTCLARVITIFYSLSLLAMQPHDQEAANELLWAGLRGLSLEKIRSALDAGADVNARERSRVSSSTPHNYTLLHYAAVRLQLDIVRELIHRGANVNAVDRDGHTPLDTVCLAVYRNYRFDRSPLVRELIFAGAHRQVDLFHIVRKFLTELEYTIVTRSAEQLIELIEHKRHEGKPVTTHELEDALALAIAQRRIESAVFILNNYTISLSKAFKVIATIIKRLKLLMHTASTHTQALYKVELREREVMAGRLICYNYKLRNRLERILAYAREPAMPVVQLPRYKLTERLNKLLARLKQRKQASFLQQLPNELIALLISFIVGIDAQK